MLRIGQCVSFETWRALCLATGAFAFIVALLGWGFGLDRAVRFQPGHPAMVPSTAACFVLISLAIFTAEGAASRAFAWIPLSAALFLVLGNEVIQAAGITGGLDALVPPELREGDRMAPGTKLGMLLAIFVIAIDGRWPFVALGAGLLGFSTALTVMFLGPAHLGSFIGVFEGMSLPTAGAFALLFGTLLMVLTRDG